MKAQIQGEWYDTDTATRIASFSKEFGADDFRHVEETLYVAANGRYFVAGGGGAMTRYAKPAGNRHCGGAGIVPVTRDQARDWCLHHGVDADTIAQYFGTPAQTA